MQVALVHSADVKMTTILLKDVLTYLKQIEEPESAYSYLTPEKKSALACVRANVKTILDQIEKVPYVNL